MDFTSQLLIFLVASFPFIVGGILLTLLVYFIVKRIEAKQGETFEKRDS